MSSLWQQRPVRSQGIQPPPPYRAPPTPSSGNGGGGSMLNISEPNVTRMSFKQQQQSTGHEIAQLRKHFTMDAAAQNVALQHLKSSGMKQHRDMDISADNLRDAASRLFARNPERSSFGSTTPAQQHFHQHQQQRFPSIRGVSAQQQDDKRNSYANQSFRNAVSSQPPQPPVGPKPSRDRLLQDQQDTMLDTELKNILGFNNNGGRLSVGGGPSRTPPLPPLSPGPIPSALMFPQGGSEDKDKPSGPNEDFINPQADQAKLKVSKVGMTPGAIDLEQMITAVAGVTSEDYEEDGVSTMIDVSDAASIRRQLDGLESMYGEVLRLLGLRKFGRQHHGEAAGPAVAAGGSKGGLRRTKLYGSMSSLPSVSSIGSRHLYNDKHRREVGGKRPVSGGGGGREKTNNKRFQRLESHVVTLARSMANLSSELRSQQVVLQEVEALRAEMHHMRLLYQHQTDADAIAVGLRSSAQARRVQKLTKFFGEEPPLLRLFLKHLGYEKYAKVLEDAKIGMPELPHVGEAKLEQLGIPIGPRMRIVEESKTASFLAGLSPSGNHVYGSPTSAAATVGGGGGRGAAGSNHQNYNVYIL